jgi:hypothetical protein
MTARAWGMPQYAPEVAAVKSRSEANPLWHAHCDTLSLHVTGRTRAGSHVVVYAHLSHPLTTPREIEGAKRRGMYCGAVALDDYVFQRLVSLEGHRDSQWQQRVWVVDHHALQSCAQGRLPLRIDDLLAHPAIVPTLGGEKQAERYLLTYQNVFPDSPIGVWRPDDYDPATPWARLITLGGGTGGGYIGTTGFNTNGMFLSVRSPRDEEFAGPRYHPPRSVESLPCN